MRIFLIVTVLLKLQTLLLLNRRNRMSGYRVNTAANSMGLMWNPFRHNCKNHRIKEDMFASYGSQRATRLWIPALSSYTNYHNLFNICFQRATWALLNSNDFFKPYLQFTIDGNIFWIFLLLSSIQRVTTKVCLYPSVDSMSLDK